MTAGGPSHLSTDAQQVRLAGASQQDGEQLAEPEITVAFRVMVVRGSPCRPETCRKAPTPSFGVILQVGATGDPAKPKPWTMKAALPPSTANELADMFVTIGTAYTIYFAAR